MKSRLASVSAENKGIAELEVGLPGADMQLTAGAIATLGPQGTSSEAAAEHLNRLLGDDPPRPVRLFPAYEAARDMVLQGGAAMLVTANAYAGIDRFYMDLRLIFKMAFVFETPSYGLAVRPQTPLPIRCRVVTHPAPRDLINQLMPPGYLSGDIIFASSTSAAAAQVADGSADIALTTQPATAIYGLRFISPKRPIRMLWSVFASASDGY